MIQLSTYVDCFGFVSMLFVFVKKHDGTCRIQQMVSEEKKGKDKKKFVPLSCRGIEKDFQDMGVTKAATEA